VDRDAQIIENLRTLREIAIEESGLKLAEIDPLSVYTSYPFPLVWQFKEIPLDHGRVEFSHNDVPMPHWNDLTIRLKVELFLLLCEEWDDLLYTFNPHIHPELIKELRGKILVSELRGRAKRRLSRLGNLPKHHFFVVESHNSKGEPVRPHIHGMAMVENAKQAKAVRLAMGKAAGQDQKGRGKLPSGNSGTFYYYQKGKSWGGYILKNVHKPSAHSIRRSFVFSRPAIQATRSFYNYITGQI
jgi:hypothetical protein